jgi:hypothetical protein
MWRRRSLETNLLQFHASSLNPFHQRCYSVVSCGLRGGAFCASCCLMLRRRSCGAGDKYALTEYIVWSTEQHGPYGYRRVTALLGSARVDGQPKTIGCIWRRGRRKVPQKQPARAAVVGRFCLRPHPGHPDQHWAYDFFRRSYARRKLRILTSSTRQATSPLRQSVKRVGD